jgi:hypothetical protein
LTCAFLLNDAFAKDVTIVYTGETHAMLYPCHCPIEPDGGIARRSSLIKTLRKTNPDLLFLDSGAFFGGGLMDQNTLNTQLDKERTLINMKAMDIMKYDAVTLSDDEFDFGSDFLLENLSNYKLPVLSCNVSGSAIFKPYVVKDAGGVKVGIIGATTTLAQQKSGAIKFRDPQSAVTDAVKELKNKGVDIIVLLSHLGEEEDLKLIAKVPDINAVIVGHNSLKQDSVSKYSSTLILRPSWQGRKLGKITLSIKDKKVVDYKQEDIRLSDKVIDDPQIRAILPRCFSDGDCRKEGLVGSCQEPASLKSSCMFTEANKVPLLIITSKDCEVCDTQKLEGILKKQFPGLTVTTVNYPSGNSAKMIKDFGIEGLPAYLLGKEAQNDKAFDALKDKLEAKGDYFMLKPEFTGLSYFMDRKKEKGRIDLFISLFDKDSVQLLEAIKDFNPVVHFLATERNGGFDAVKGILEVEEDSRCACVQKYYPKEFFNYLISRSKNINSSWWEDSLANLDTQVIKNCARGQEGAGLLKDNIKLNKELKVMFGPSYLTDNQEIFGTKGVPSKEEFKKIFKR